MLFIAICMSYTFAKNKTVQPGNLEFQKWRHHTKQLLDVNFVVKIRRRLFGSVWTVTHLFAPNVNKCTNAAKHYKSTK